MLRKSDTRVYGLGNPCLELSLILHIAEMDASPLEQWGDRQDTPMKTVLDDQVSQPCTERCN